MLPAQTQAPVGAKASASGQPRPTPKVLTLTIADAGSFEPFQPMGGRFSDENSVEFLYQVGLVDKPIIECCESGVLGEITPIECFGHAGHPPRRLRLLFLRWCLIT